MKTYNIKIISQRNSIILIALLLSIFIGGRLMLLPKSINQGLAILLTALVAVISYLLWQKLVTGKTEWTLDDTGLQVIWMKQFAFTHIEDIRLSWSDIDSFSDKADLNYHTFKIKLRSGQTVKFYHDNLTTGDDYKQFTEDFALLFKAMQAAANNNV
ncbi:hypothetical protein OCK74_19710 [Chitinophagaceae bacterium LB-8]|uniref:Uncharacterized protein n=1 Tax=Paraflavisolibacter caeni TaxID=2982496 RepID=A0A9X2Y196_9BACT|nr:hypothetical protein [Paraflavisolibacter caeni]MCU7551358.1 hypothetical protein [Paraflavisolibacter caeni]